MCHFHIYQILGIKHIYIYAQLHKYILIYAYINTHIYIHTCYKETHIKHTRTQNTKTIDNKINLLIQIPLETLIGSMNLFKC